MPDLNKSVVKLSKRAYYLMGKRRYIEAEKVFQEAYALNAENAYILVGLGDLYRKLKNFQKAIQYYDLVLTIDPVNVFALRGLGNAYRGMKQPGESLIYWERYLQCNRYDTHVMVRMADTYKKMDKFQEAMSFYNDKYAYLGMGTLNYKLGEDDAALSCFEKYQVFDESNVAVLTMLGNIFQRRKQFDTASVYFKKTIEVDSDNVFALYGLGNCERGLGNFHAAVQLWCKVLEFEPENQNLYTRVGDACFSLDNLDESKAYYEKSLALGFDPYAHLGLSSIHIKNNALDEAERCCNLILEKLPSHSRALKEISRITTLREDGSAGPGSTGILAK